MKKTIFTISLVLVCLIVSSQTGYYYNTPAITPNGNPGNLNGNWEKPFGGGLASGWVDIQSSSHPSWTAVQNIPFTFLFNGSAVTQYKVSTTGILTFSVGDTTVPGIVLPIPSSNIPDKSICIWGLKYGGSYSNDHIVKKTFGYAPNRQHWIFFSSYDIQNGNNDCWTYWSIVLEETSNKIFIVDQRCSDKNNCEPFLTLGLQINTSSAVQIAGSPGIPSYAGKSKTPSDNKYYEFIPGSRPIYDMSVNWIQTNSYQTKGLPIEIRGTLKNYALLAVKSYRINYQIDSGAIKSEYIAATNLPMYAEDWYFHDSIWNPSSTGAYTIKVWADSINGHLDQNTVNDTLVKVVNVMGVFVPRLVFHEVFSSSSSVDCKIGNDSLKILLDANHGTYSLIKYQLPNDPYSTSECLARKAYYSVDSLPDMFINGINQIAPAYYDTIQFQDFSAPAYLSLTPTISVSGTKVTVTVAILPFPEYVDPGHPLKAHIAIVERTTTGNATTNGETIFYNVLKKMIPDENGTSVGPFQTGVYVNLNKSYTFPSGNTVEDFNDLGVIVFIQDETTKEVIQSAYTDLTAGINNNYKQNDHIVNLFPNPANNFTNLNYLVSKKSNVDIKVYNIIGEVVYSQNIGTQPQGVHTTLINTSNYANGLYILKLSVGNSVYTRKFTIDK